MVLTNLLWDSQILIQRIIVDALLFNMLNLDQLHILQLNDDCFHNIFKYLSTLDWATLSETYTRFRAISNYLFETKYKSFALEPEDVYGLRMTLSVRQAKRLAPKFGPNFILFYFIFPIMKMPLDWCRCLVDIVMH